MSESVRELTQQIARGDGEALARFYEARFDSMYHDARRITGRDDSFCLDVVQNAMMRIIRSTRPLDDEQALQRWLHVVVRTAALDMLRRETAQSRRRDGRREAVRSRHSSDADANLADRVAWLRDELNRLDPAAHDLLMMRHHLGWTLEQISRLLNIAPSAVHRRLAAVIARLRMRAKETLDEPK